MQDMNHTNHETGYTLIELLTTMVILAILAGSVFMIYMDSYRDSTRKSVQATLDSSSQIAMSVIEHDIRYSFSYNTALPIGFTDPYGSDNSGTPITYKGASATSRALILAQYATTTNSLSNTRQSIYIQATFNCGTNMYDNPKLPYTILYFIRNSTLYRRILTDTTTSTCNPPQYQKQSCPPEVTPWNMLCKTADEVIADHVTNFSVSYYSGSDTTPTDVYSSSDPAILDTMDSAEITLTLAPQGGGPLSSSIKMRVAKVNH